MVMPVALRLLDVRKRRWSQLLLDAIDSGLEEKLPPADFKRRPAGRLQTAPPKLSA